MFRSINRTLLVAAVTCIAGSTLTSGNAIATQHEATSEAWIGYVDVMLEGDHVSQAPIAPCDVEGDQQNDSGAVTVDGAATFWGGQTVCEWDSSDAAHGKVTGRYFSTKAIEEWGGPRIKVSTFKVSCVTTGNGSSGSMELSGLRGIQVPERIPPNYTVTIPGRIEGAKPLAKIIVNELVTPAPADGSMQVNALHIILFPEGGPSSGEIIVGSVSCDPYGA